MTDLFARFADAGFGPDLVSVIPPGAALHEGFAGIAVGKAPGRTWSGKWAPRKDWETHRATGSDLAEWAATGANVGLKAERWPGIDIDLDDPELAEAVRAMVLLELGFTVTRIGRAPRCLLVYRLAGAPFRKRKLILRDAAGVKLGAVEVLGQGQQYLIGGMHPSGVAFSWRDGRDLADVAGEGAELPAITKEDADTLLEALTAALARRGITCKLAGAADPSAQGVVQSDLRAPSFDAVAKALAALPNDATLDYDEWIRVGRAVKAACSGVAGAEIFGDGLDLWTDWSAAWTGGEAASAEQCETKWATFYPPHAIGWRYLADHARAAGFQDAVYAFDAIPEPAPAQKPSAGAESGRGDDSARPPGLEAVRDAVVWVHEIKRLVRLRDGKLFDREQFNVTYRHLGSPSSRDKCAWARILACHDLREVVGLTYRPGGAQFVTEAHGPCLNAYREPATAGLRRTAAGAKRWLDHLAYIVPDARERQAVLEFFACTVQRPGVKISYALVLKGAQGTGKDMLIEPVRHGVGLANAGYLGVTELQEQFTGWAKDKKLIVVQEVHSFTRKETMQKLKGLISGLPDTIRINTKNVPAYDVPNVLGFVMFTNLADALAIEAGDRRLFVIDSPALPRDAAYYQELWAWYAGGGTEAVIGYLQSLDLSRFDASGRAPETEAKHAMRRAAASGLEAWIQDGIEAETAPFEADLVALNDVVAGTPEHVARGGARARQIMAALKAVGALVLFDGARVRLADVTGGQVEGQTYLLALRRHEMYARLGPDKAIELFAKQRGEARGVAAFRR